jgi:putative hydrolase of the HAD superfamily
VLVEAGRQAPQELIFALIAIYRTHTPCITIAPDAAEALDAISRIASIAVISDGPATSQSRKVEALGLASLASPIILTELLGSEFCKPHPKAFELVQQCCPANIYLYIADNPLKDFAAPKQLGWITVRVRRPHGLHYAAENSAMIADHELADCSGLPVMLAQLI